MGPGHRRFTHHEFLLGFLFVLGGDVGLRSHEGMRLGLASVWTAGQATYSPSIPRRESLDVREQFLLLALQRGHAHAVLVRARNRNPPPIKKTLMRICAP